MSSSLLRDNRRQAGHQPPRSTAAQLPPRLQFGACVENIHLVWHTGAAVVPPWACGGSIGGAELSFEGAWGRFCFPPKVAAFTVTTALFGLFRWREFPVSQQTARAADGVSTDQKAKGAIVLNFPRSVSTVCG